MKNWTGYLKMAKLLVAGVCLLGAAQAHAYVIASYGDKTLDVNKRTNFILVGHGKDLDYMFLHSARITAMRMKEVDPSEQVVIISVEEKSDSATNEAMIKQDGFTIQEHKTGFFNKLDVKKMVALMMPYKQISSFHMFSHSTPQFGALIDGTMDRIEVDFTSDWDLSQLDNNFTADAYGIFHGCNAGWVLAPMMAKIWGIPVAGALTSTDFERPATDSKWYLNNDAAHPSNVKWAMSTHEVRTKLTTCYNDDCYRMKPMYSTYHGYWSDGYDAGLPLYKFFCPANTDATCRQAMARNVLHSASVININKDVTFDDYKTAVKDLFCPMDTTGKIRTECLAKLDNAAADKTYVPFKAKAMTCDKTNCKFEFTCGGAVAFFYRKSCNITLTTTAPGTTYMDEYLDTLDAFKYIKNPAPLETRTVLPLPDSQKFNPGGH